MSWDSKDALRGLGKPHRPHPVRRRFLGLELWQQVVAGLVVAAIVALVGHIFLNSHRTPASSATGRTGTSTWLDQLTPVSGQISPSNAAPDTTNESFQPLSHELIVSPAQNETIVTYNLDGEYKTLNIEVAATGDESVSSGTLFAIGLDGKTYPLNPPTNDADFFPGVTEPLNWAINVSGIRKLELAVKDGASAQGPDLLISAVLKS